MESPSWTPRDSSSPNRPWMGMALLIAVPILALILIRMLWSGSGLWFLSVGLILLGVAAVLFLARRPQEEEGPALNQESNRLPLVLAGIGVVFLAMLLLPNYAGGSDDNADLTASNGSDQEAGLITDVGTTNVQSSPSQGVHATPTAQSELQPTIPQEVAADEPPASDEPSDSTEGDSENTGSQQQVPPEGSQTYVVQDGDTLWDIAVEFDSDVDAIVTANGLDNPGDIQVDQELVIPPASDEDTTAGADVDGGGGNE